MAKQRTKNMQVSEEDRSAAASWWNSLPGGKKQYLKVHSKLTSSDKQLRYWLANIKQVPSLQNARPCSSDIDAVLAEQRFNLAV